MKKLIFRLVAVVALVVFAQGLVAQTDEADIGASFKKLEPAEEQRLRAILAEPIPQAASLTTLRELLNRKFDATAVLGDVVQREATLREAVRLLPDAEFRHALANSLHYNGHFGQSEEMGRLAVTAATPEEAPRIGKCMSELCVRQESDRFP